jgi:hypothetical protein
MTSTDDQNDTSTPQQAIRRFDVFAEYSRQEREEKGYPADEAKGYGVWLAKVVAARRFGTKSESSGKAKSTSHKDEPPEEPKFRSLGDELQTDATFDQDIIDRMGAAFYDAVFVPAISEARENGKSYESIRDQIRKDWKPAKSKSK